MRCPGLEDAHIDVGSRGGRLGAQRVAMVVAAALRRHPQVDDRVVRASSSAWVVPTDDQNSSGGRASTRPRPRSRDHTGRRQGCGRRLPPPARAGRGRSPAQPVGTRVPPPAGSHRRRSPPRPRAGPHVRQNAWLSAQLEQGRLPGPQAPGEDDAAVFSCTFVQGQVTTRTPLPSDAVTASGPLWWRPPRTTPVAFDEVPAEAPARDVERSFIAGAPALRPVARVR